MSAALENDDDTAAFWSDLNKVRREERHDRGAQDIDVLKRYGVVYSSNDGDVHLMIDDKVRGRVDFWPTTGRWQCLAGKRKGTGISKLLDYLGIEHEPIAPFLAPQPAA